jgi:hypothetical protein
MIREIAREVIEKEAGAVAGLLDHLDGNFDRAVLAILETTGRVIDRHAGDLPTSRRSIPWRSGNRHQR